jgi:HEAT repeat protein
VLNRPETEYRAEAAKALGILGDKTAVESLKELLYSGTKKLGKCRKVPGNSGRGSLADHHKGMAN